MKKRWSVILPVVGLLAFSAVTYESFRWSAQGRIHPGRYFFWSSIRLDTDPAGRRPKPAGEVLPCPDGSQDCLEFDPGILWVTPGYLALALEVAAFPALVAAFMVVVGLGRLGVNQLWTFMLTAPLFIGAWFYLLGWLLDRWRCRRSKRPQPPSS
jgi:hypothetical protein